MSQNSIWLVDRLLAEEVPVPTQVILRRARHYLQNCSREEFEMEFLRLHDRGMLPHCYPSQSRTLQPLIAKILQPAVENLREAKLTCDAVKQAELSVYLHQASQQMACIAIAIAYELSHQHLQN
jgi:hypothetical protein